MYSESRVQKHEDNNIRVEESSDPYFSALVVIVHERREPKSNVVNDTLQVGVLSA